MEDPNQFQINVKATFDKVKQVNHHLEAEINQIKGVLEQLKSTINSLTNVHNKEKNIEFPQEIMGSPTTDNRQQTTTDSTPTTINRQQTTEIPLFQLKKELDSMFLKLTDRELSVFLALYTLDNEKKGEVDYFELSQRLNLTESTIRDFISQLIRKGLPIQKERTFNRKVSLSIKNEFKTLNLYEKLLKLKVSRQGQKTLFDI